MHPTNQPLHQGAGEAGKARSELSTPSEATSHLGSQGSIPEDGFVSLKQSHELGPVKRKRIVSYPRLLNRLFTFCFKKFAIKNADM